MLWLGGGIYKDLLSARSGQIKGGSLCEIKLIPLVYLVIVYFIPYLFNNAYLLF